MNSPPPPRLVLFGWLMPLLAAWRFVVWHQPPSVHREWERDEVVGLIHGMLLLETALALLVAVGVWSTGLEGAGFIGLTIGMAPAGSMISFQVWFRRQHTVPFEWRLAPPATCVRLSLIGWVVGAPLAAAILLLAHVFHGAGAA